MSKNYIFIPTYNERETVEARIREIGALELDIHVLVVDDNSPDGTAQIVEELKKEFPRLELLVRYDRRGRGLAGIDAFKYCLAHGADHVVEMDVDSSHDPQYIPRMLEEADANTVVIGSRLVRGSKQIGRSAFRRSVTWLSNRYSAWLFGLSVKDVIGGFKCYPRAAVESLDWDDFMSWGYSIGIETLVRLARKGFIFKEIPITFVDREHGKSKFNGRVFVDSIVTIHRLRMKLNA